MKIVRHSAWSILGRWWPATRRRTIAIAVVIHHSVTRVGIDPQANARAVDSIIHSRRFKSGFTMIAYNYLIDPDGTVFEGRGITYRNGANGNKKGGPYKNSNTLSICFIGNFEEGQPIPTINPTEKSLRAAGELLNWLVLQGALQSDMNVFPHKNVAFTECCGDRLEVRIPNIIEYRNNPTTPIGGNDMPYVIELEPGINKVVLPGLGSTLVNSPAHWAERCVEANRTGIFSSPSMPQLLDDQRHVDLSEELAGVIDPFRSEIQTTLEELTDGHDYVGPSASTIADRVILGIQKIWSKP